MEKVFVKMNENEFLQEINDKLTKVREVMGPLFGFKR